MSKPRFDWWSYVKRMTRKYPQYCRELQELKVIPSTPNYDAVGHGSGISKPTEQVALKRLPVSKQRDYDAVRLAVEETERQSNGRHKIELIRLVYWKNSHTLTGAAYKIGIEQQTAWFWHRDFLRLVGLHRGLITREEWEELLKKEKNKDKSQNSVLS